MVISVLSKTGSLVENSLTGWIASVMSNPGLLGIKNSFTHTAVICDDKLVINPESQFMIAA